jgi:uncharacterized OB-fold protein
MFKWFGIVNHTPHTKVAAFAEHLRAGRLMGSRCRACGTRAFPPRAHCERCLSDDFELVPVSGRGRLYTWTRIDAAPSGFEAWAPYTIGVVDLDEGGRALAWIGASVPAGALRAGLELELVPRVHEETEAITVDYTLEAPAAAARAGAGAEGGKTR